MLLVQRDKTEPLQCYLVLKPQWSHKSLCECELRSLGCSMLVLYSAGMTFLIRGEDVHARTLLGPCRLVQEQPARCKQAPTSVLCRKSHAHGVMICSQPQTLSFEIMNCTALHCTVLHSTFTSAVLPPRTSEAQAAGSAITSVGAV